MDLNTKFGVISFGPKVIELIYISLPFILFENLLNELGLKLCASSTVRKMTQPLSTGLYTCI